MQYYENNKAKLLTKINCECGGKYQICTKNRHLHSKRHLNFINNNIIK